MGSLRVALVNDYEVVVRGLAAMLRAYQDSVRVVELDLNSPVETPVDIALYDTFAATQGDKQDVHDLAANPRVRRVVVYSWVLDAELIRAAVINGAGGYVSKGVPARGLVHALQQIHAGGERVWIGAGDEPTLFAGDWPGREEGLTQREAEVLALITQGLSNAQIAERTHLSPNSIKTHIRSCYRRLGIASRTNAVLWGVEHGFRPDRLRVHAPKADLSTRTPGEETAIVHRPPPPGTDADDPVRPATAARGTRLPEPTNGTFA